MYFGEIVAEEPRFRLRCDKSMRITLSQADGPNGRSPEGPEAFSEVDKIVALRNVMISRIQKKNLKKNYFSLYEIHASNINCFFNLSIHHIF